MYNNSGIYNLCSNLTHPWLLSPGGSQSQQVGKSARRDQTLLCSNFAQRPVPRRTFERSAAAATAEPEWVHLAVQESILY